MAFLNEARKINPKASGIDLMLADQWKRLSTLKAEIRGEQQEISELFFSSDGSALAAQYPHGALRRFDLNPTRLKLTSDRFIAHMPHPLIFSSTAHLTGFFKQTDPENPGHVTRELRRIDWHSETDSGTIPWPKDQLDPALIVASPSGNLLATYSEVGGNQPSNIVELWKFEDAKVVRSQFSLTESPGNFHWLFSADERTLAQLRYAGSTFDVTFRDSSTGEILQQFPPNSRPEAQATTANRICIGLNNGAVIEFQREQDFSQRTPSDGTITQVASLQYSSDGKQLLVGGAMGNVVLYNSKDFSIALQLDRQKFDGVVKRATLSQKGRFIAVTHQKQVSVFMTDSSDLFGRFSWTGSRGSTSTFSNDESLLAAGTENGSIRIWDLEQQPLWHREFQPNEAGSLFDFSPIRLLKATKFSFVVKKSIFWTSLPAPSATRLHRRAPSQRSPRTRSSSNSEMASRKSPSRTPKPAIS